MPGVDVAPESDPGDVLDGDRTQALALLVRPAGEVNGDEQGIAPEVLLVGGDAVVDAYGIDVGELVGRMRLRAAAGETGVVTLPRLLPGRLPPAWAGLPERMVLLGVGDGSQAEMRRAGAALSRAVEGLERVVAMLGEGVLDDDAVVALVEGFLLAAYRPPRTGRTDPPSPPATTLALLGEVSEDAVSGAQRSATAAWSARRLSATPSNTKTPAWFAQEAERLASDVPGVSVTVRRPAWLAEHGFGALLAVGAGSAHDPLLVLVDYEPVPGPLGHGAERRPDRGHVVLVGKGVTFDTGGLSIKPADTMAPMKTDMSGAAAALAAVLGAAEAGAGRRVTAVLPLVENAVGGAAYRPGDVLRVQDGTTVEVLNTDAEGRLILADALAWVGGTLRPTAVVDVATLTGAASVGLGRRHAALYATDDALAEQLTRAGEETGERTWRMPLVPEYAAALHSDVADVANAATDPHVGGGSITAAIFLSRFTRGVRWAHLDIAGPARAQKAQHEVPEGATGFGARLLLRWLLSA